eukprot:1131891-Amphidinium_carterae.1
MEPLDRFIVRWNSNASQQNCAPMGWKQWFAEMRRYPSGVIKPGNGYTTGVHVPMAYDTCDGPLFWWSLGYV